MTLNKNFFAGLILGLGLLAIFAFKPAANPPAAAVQKWGYLKMQVGFASEAKLSEQGQKGWELVALESGVGYFKRPAE